MFKPTGVLAYMIIKTDRLSIHPFKIMHVSVCVCMCCLAFVANNTNNHDAPYFFIFKKIKTGTSGFYMGLVLSISSWEGVSLLFSSS